MTSQEEQGPEPVQLPIVPRDIRDAALTELDRLSRFMDGLPIDRWKTPSAVSTWTIGDVVVHLDLAVGLYSRLLGAIASGGGSGRAWRALGRITETVVPAASPALNALNNAIPRLVDRALSPEVVKGQFAAGARKLRERLDAIGPDDYTRPIYYVGGPYPLSFFLAMMVNELAVHGWDMESRLEPGAHLDLEARSVLPWFYFGGTPFMLHMPRGMAGTIQVELENPGATMWWSIAEPKTTQRTGTAPNPDATIRGPSGIYALTLAGRISPEDALSSSLTIDGNEALGRAFLKAWRVI